MVKHEETKPMPVQNKLLCMLVFQLIDTSYTRFNNVTCCTGGFLRTAQPEMMSLKRDCVIFVSYTLFAT